MFNDLVLPKYASTSYFQYISLRILKLALFLGIIYSLNYLFQKYSFEKIITFLLISCLIISTLSIISYFSYLIGYSDFPRNRSGSGGWTQPIERACSILRNYGTFREPSFLAVWVAPIIPLIFYLARKSKAWYLISIIPLTSLVLTRSLTGIISIVLVFSVVVFIELYKNKSLNVLLVIPIIFIFLISIFGNNFGYKFPALDPSMCPPESADKCDCSIYDDDQDLAKNSSNIYQSVFERFSIISSGGIGGFENIDILGKYISTQKVENFW